MKPLLLFFFLLFILTASSQSLDYISVRKANGQVVKNYYAGSDVVFQLNDGSYLRGPIQTIRNDSVYVTLYDIRYYPTTWGTYMKDTIATRIVGIRYKEISRIFLNRHRSFFQRMAGPLLMIGGAGYLTVNVLNGAFYHQPITDSKNLQRIGTAAGVFGLGYLFKRLFASDGFSKKNERIVYVDL
jgi:hypothetical protein